MNQADWFNATGSQRFRSAGGMVRPMRDPRTRELIRASMPAKEAPPKSISAMTAPERDKARAEINRMLKQLERDRHRLKSLLFQLDIADGP